MCVWRNCPNYCKLHRLTEQGVTVWGVLSFDSRTHLIVISGTVTAQLYDDDILQSVLLSFLLRHPGFTFQHNTHLRMTRVAMNCLQACPKLPWPAWFPDLSPTEHIWEVMRKRLQPSRNIDDLVQQLETVCREISQNTIQ